MRRVRSRILCVDADPASVRWIRDDLGSSNLDIEITAVDGGRAALRTLYRASFDLCIADYALPDMTGLQLCCLIRQIGYEVPVMIFTTHNCRVDRVKAETAGASEFLCKPDESIRFSAAVKSRLRVRRMVHHREHATTAFSPVP